MKTVTGDLFALPTSADAIGHGCNLRGVMGAGVAAEFRRRFPTDYDLYSTVCRSADARDGSLLGESLLSGTGVHEYARFCMFTQVDPGANAVAAAIGTATSDALVQCAELDIPRLFIPLLGCGIGGLTWDDVRPHLEAADALEPDVELVVVEFKPATAPHRARAWDVV